MKRRKHKQVSVTANEDLLTQKKHETLTKEQLATLDDYVQSLENHYGFIQNALVSYMLSACPLALFPSLLLATDQNRQLLEDLFDTVTGYKNIEALFTKENFYNFFPVLVNSNIYFIIKYLLNNYYPFGAFEKITPDMLSKAYTNPELAEDLVHKLREMDYKSIKQVVIIVSFIVALQTSSGFNPGLYSLFPCIDVTYIAINFFKNFYLKKVPSEKIIETQIDLLNKIVESSVFWEAKEETFNFRAVFRGHEVELKTLRVPNKTFAKQLGKLINSRSSPCKMYSDTHGLLVINPDFTLAEAYTIHNILIKTLKNWVHLKQTKQTMMQFLNTLIPVTEVGNLLTWYLEKDTVSNAFLCVSTRLTGWSAEQINSFLAILNKYKEPESENTIKFINNRIIITAPYQLSSEQIKQLQNYLRELSREFVQAKRKKTEITSLAIAEPSLTRPLPAAWTWSSFFANKAAYVPGLNKFITRSQSGDSEKGEADATPSISLPAKEFSHYPGVRFYDPQENYKKILQREGVATIPFFHQGRHTGYLLLSNSSLQKLPDQGEYVCKLIDENLQQKDGHFIPVSKNSNWFHQTGADYKMRLFGKYGGNARGALNEIEPDTPNKNMNELPVYQYGIIKKHFKG